MSITNVNNITMFSPEILIIKMNGQLLLHRFDFMRLFDFFQLNSAVGLVYVMYEKYSLNIFLLSNIF